VQFTEVKNAHIVPRFYLRNFAIDDSVLLGVDGRLLEHPVSIDNTAVRRRFYRRFRPDGTPIDDIEWSLSQLEDVIAPMLVDLQARWPPATVEAKGALAEFFAFQFVRGPRWKAWRESMAREAIEEYRRNPEPIMRNGIWIPASHREVNEIEVRLLSDTEWLTRMMVIANRLITAFGSMRWHLIEFEKPLLAISDQPVVAWPLAALQRLPEPTPNGLGVMNFLEVRVPITPWLALLMTWQDLPDQTEPIRGSAALAANINAFTIANSDRQWMQMPGAETPIASAYLDPLAPELIAGYRPEEVERSAIRDQVRQLLEQKQGQDIHEAVDDEGRMHAQIVRAGGAT
jgi:Protein of unknown function (DUF4238)